jgi:uncharacterized membrane protein required for colicin V production
MDSWNVDLTQLDVLDVLIAVYLLFGAVSGVRRGLSGEIARLISLGVAVIAGWQFHEPLGEQVERYTRLQGPPAFLVGFLATVLAAGLIMLLLRLMLKNIMEFAFKGKIERVGGLIAGILRAAFISSLIVVAISVLPVPYLQKRVWEESRVGMAICKLILPIYQDIADEHPEWGLPPVPYDAPHPNSLPRDPDPLPRDALP